MNGKYYVGDRVSSYEKYNEVGPITGVRVITGSDTDYQAGDFNGYVFTVQCNFGTQDIANNMLIALRGKTYKGYRAGSAPLPSEAELGDAITVNRLYSFLAYQKMTFGPGHMSEIAAPGSNELSHEFQYTGTTRKDYTTDIDNLRTFITQSLGSMQSELVRMKTDIQEIGMKVDEISTKLADLDFRVQVLEAK